MNEDKINLDISSNTYGLSLTAEETYENESKEIPNKWKSLDVTDNEQQDLENAQSAKMNPYIKTEKTENPLEIKEQLAQDIFRDIKTSIKQFNVLPTKPVNDNGNMLLNTKKELIQAIFNDIDASKASQNCAQVQTDTNNLSQCSKDEKPFLPFTEDMNMLIKTENYLTEDSNSFDVNSGNEVMGSFVKQEFVHVEKASSDKKCEVNTSGENGRSTSVSNPSLLSETGTILPEYLEQKLLVSTSGSQPHSEHVEDTVLEEDDPQNYTSNFKIQHACLHEPNSQVECHSDTQVLPNGDVTKSKQHHGDMCKKTCTCGSNLTDHKQGRYYKVHKCELCNKLLNCKSHLERHLAVHTELHLHQCVICKKTFTDKGNLAAHKRRHVNVKPFHCEICKKTYITSSELKIHLRVHTKEKPYQCGICNTSFTQQKSLTVHQRIHTKEKPYQCGICNKSFTQQSSFTTHQRIHTKEKPYKCELCQKAFFTISNLKRHHRVHTKEMPYQCDICGKLFSYHDHLTVHQRIHNNEKPFKCELCDKTFTQSSNLKKHYLVHTKQKSY